MPMIPAPDRRVTLLRVGQTLMVVSSLGAGDRPFEPFPLPRLPWSCVQWLSAIGLRHYRQRKTYLALTLLVDRLTRKWMATVPSQTSRLSDVLWQIDHDDYVDLPDHLLIAGSFQTMRSAGLFQSVGALPAFDGIHLIAQPSTTGDALTFLRVEERTSLADPLAVMTDDIADLLLRYGSRLHRGT